MNSVTWSRPVDFVEWAFSTQPPSKAWRSREQTTEKETENERRKTDSAGGDHSRVKARYGGGMGKLVELVGERAVLSKRTINLDVRLDFINNIYN